MIQISLLIKLICQWWKAQLYLIFQPLYYTLKQLGDTGKFALWKSKGLLTKKLTTSTITDNSLSPSIEWYKNSIYFSKYNIFFIVYELDEGLLI